MYKWTTTTDLERKEQEARGQEKKLQRVSFLLILFLFRIFAGEMVDSSFAYKMPERTGEAARLNLMGNQLMDVAEGISPGVPESYGQCVFESRSCYRRALIQNYSNYKRSAPPSKFMFYENGSWVDFSSEVFEVMKSGFLAGKSMVEVPNPIKGSGFLVDFLRMLVMDMSSGKQRSISWIDVNGNFFFPKQSVDEEIDEVREMSICDKVDREIRIDEKSLKRIRDPVLDFVQEQSGHSSFTEQDEKRPRIALERPRWANVKQLKHGDNTYSVIKKNFLSGLRRIDLGASITAIHHCLYDGTRFGARLEDFKKQAQVTKATRGESNVKLAWHGTSAKAVDSILTYGFGMPSMPSGAKSYGVGVYLSPAHSPQTSAVLSEADENDEKHVMLCRIIMGNVEKVEVGSQQFHPSSEEFDTGVDDLENPSWYIVWSTHMNRHILPVCVVSFKSSYYRPGLSTGSEICKIAPGASNMSFRKLLSEIEHSLSSSKTRHLENLYSLYKVGKVAKDVFIRQLRLVAGDELLLSAIRKIRSFVCK